MLFCHLNTVLDLVSTRCLNSIPYHTCRRMPLGYSPLFNQLLEYMYMAILGTFRRLYSHLPHLLKACSVKYSVRLQLVLSGIEDTTSASDYDNMGNQMVGKTEAYFSFKLRKVITFCLMRRSTIPDPSFIILR